LVLWLQPEGGYNQLVLMLQPEGRSKSLILCHQLEGGNNTISFPHPTALKYKCIPIFTTTITATVTTTIIVKSTCPTDHYHKNLSIQSLSHPLNQIHSHPHETHAKITKILSQTICSTSLTHASTKHVPISPHTITIYVSQPSTNLCHA
jgi:hypothetical protein